MEALGVRLLDLESGTKFDVSGLDQIVQSMNDPSNAHRTLANQIMVALQEHKQAWTRVAEILEESNVPQTRFFALQILEDAIKYRWKVLPTDQREGIKSYIVSKVLSMASDETVLHGVETRTFVKKLDLVLVQILKQEWPHNWPNFITDLIASSKTSEVLCENNMTILKLLSEEIFDFSKDQMTSNKAKVLKQSLNQEFTQIFQLCEFVLENSTHAPLLTVTLQTLLRFIGWIPIGYIFETKLLDLLMQKYLVVTQFRNDVLSVLADIASLQEEGEKYEHIWISFHSLLLKQLTQSIVPAEQLDNRVLEQDEIFVQRLSLVFTSLYKNHGQILERKIQHLADEQHLLLMTGMTYLVNISSVDDDGIFKICLEFWHHFTKTLYLTSCSSGSGGNSFFLETKSKSNSRKEMYVKMLSRVRVVMISKMVKPSEVLIVEDENGEIVRETTKDTEALSQYNTMHETLVYLTHLDYEDTENIMLEKLALQVDGQEWSWNNLNTLCWAIGSISGAMSEENEKRFLVTVIKDLLGLCEMKKGKDNKAVIASNIMYVVGQYPRFLRAHWKFLKTVVNKLFEFMHELHPGVQDMACDTFLKIARKCKKKFVVLQKEERVAFVEELIANLATTVSDLQTHQMHVFYQAVASMLSALNMDKQKQIQLVGELMSLPNQSWKAIMYQAAQANGEVLFRGDVIKELMKIIRSNKSVCENVGLGNFNNQMGEIFSDLMNVYSAYGENIASRVEKNGEIQTKTAEVRAMRAAKREILGLLITFLQQNKPIVEHNKQNSNTKGVLLDHFLPALLPVILTDYKRQCSAARESEVLVCMATALDVLGAESVAIVPKILENVFEVTLQMITQNFQDFPEHRVNFFKLLQAVNKHCFESLFNIPPEHQKLVVDSIVWAFKHTERNVAETGLETLYALLVNVGNNTAIAQSFYQSFYISLLQDILAVLTDRLHKFGFKMHATILRLLFSLVVTNQITLPLDGHDPANNISFLRSYVGNMIATSFPNLSQSQVLEFVEGCFDLRKDLATFKAHLRDFMVQIKEFAGEDNKDLYLEENLAESKMAAQAELQSRLAVPGLVNPNENPTNDDDLADL